MFLNQAASYDSFYDFDNIWSCFELAEEDTRGIVRQINVEKDGAHQYQLPGINQYCVIIFEHTMNFLDIF